MAALREHHDDALNRPSDPSPVPDRGGADTGTLSVDDLAAARAEFAALRKERIAAERAASTGAAAELAVRAAEQDRDAGFTQEIEELRRAGEELSERLRRSWASADRFRALMERLAAQRGLPTRSGPLSAAAHSFVARCVEESAARRRAAATLEAIAATLEVPEPYPLDQTDTRGSGGH
jgi:hypothetical protein